MFVLILFDYYTKANTVSYMSFCCYHSFRFVCNLLKALFHVCVHFMCSLLCCVCLSAFSLPVARRQLWMMQWKSKIPTSGNIADMLQNFRPYQIMLAYLCCKMLPSRILRIHYSAHTEFSAELTSSHRMHHSVKN